MTLTALVAHAAQFEWTISAAFLGAAALYLYVSAGRGKTTVADGVWIWLLLILTYGIPFGCIFYGIARLRPGLPLEDLPKKRECKKVGI